MISRCKLHVLVQRARREAQREAGRKAREAREAGNVPGGDHKHPLNSERRRANKRRPSKGMRAAAAKKLKREEDESRGEWRKGGFEVRKGLKGGQRGEQSDGGKGGGRGRGRDGGGRGGGRRGGWGGGRGRGYI